MKRMLFCETLLNVPVLIPDGLIVCNDFDHLKKNSNNKDN